MAVLRSEDPRPQGPGQGQPHEFKPKPKPLIPITDAMKKGKEPMRTFGDLMQFFVAKTDDKERPRRIRSNRASSRPRPQRMPRRRRRPVPVDGPVEPALDPARQPGDRVPGTRLRWRVGGDGAGSVPSTHPQRAFA